MITLAIAGLACATTIAIGVGFVVPVSSAVGDCFDVFAIGSAIFFVGLLDGK